MNDRYLFVFLFLDLCLLCLLLLLLLLLLDLDDLLLLLLLAPHQFLLLDPLEQGLFISLANLIDPVEILLLLHETLDDRVVPDILVPLLDQNVEQNVRLVLFHHRQLGLDELVLHAFCLLDVLLQLHVFLQQAYQFGHPGIHEGVSVLTHLLFLLVTATLLVDVLQFDLVLLHPLLDLFVLQGLVFRIAVFVVFIVLVLVPSPPRFLLSLRRSHADQVFVAQGGKILVFLYITHLYLFVG